MSFILRPSLIYESMLSLPTSKTLIEYESSKLERLGFFVHMGTGTWVQKTAQKAFFTSREK